MHAESSAVRLDEESIPHPGTDPAHARFYAEIRRNHPEVSDEEIAALFAAWNA